MSIFIVFQHLPLGGFTGGLLILLLEVYYMLLHAKCVLSFP